MKIYTLVITRSDGDQFIIPFSEREFAQATVDAYEKFDPDGVWIYTISEYDLLHHAFMPKEMMN